MSEEDEKMSTPHPKYPMHLRMIQTGQQRHELDGIDRYRFEVEKNLMYIEALRQWKKENE